MLPTLDARLAAAAELDLHEVGSGRLIHIQNITDDGITGHLLCVLVFFLFEHIENIKHDVFPFCLGALTANPAVPLYYTPNRGSFARALRKSAYSSA